MKIYFSPSYNSAVYIDLDALNGSIAMDTSVCDLHGLVSLIELHSGIYSPEMSVYELQVMYMRALMDMDKEHPNNVLHESLKVDALSTAKECLEWREKLIIAGWTPNMDLSSRLKALAKTEKHFKHCTLANRILKLPETISSSGISKDIHLIIPYAPYLMHPAVRAIIEALNDKGATIEIMPNAAIAPSCNLAKLGDWYASGGKELSITESDSTVEVIEFENRDKTVEWLATLDPKAHEVWISDHCADIDRALTAYGKATCGSMADAGLPPITQIAMLAISQFVTPVNINKLVAWLRLPRSPLPNVRFKIAAGLLKEGGYDPEKIEAWIDEYLANHPDADKSKINHDLKKYLHISVDKKADKKEFINFIESLRDWVEEQCESEYKSEFHAQYNDLNSRLKALLLLTENHKADAIDNAILEEWILMCTDACSYPQFAAQKGAHMVISNPGNIIGNADHAVWCSFSNFTPHGLAYDFLTQAETQSIVKAGCKIYDPDVESQVIRIEQQWPLRHCKRLTIIEMAKKDSDEVRGIMSQRLRSLPKKDWDMLITDTPTVNGKNSIIDLGNNFIKVKPKEINIMHGNYITFKQLESYTSLKELIYKPLQYLLKYVLGIHDYSSTIHLTLGNVAHHVIECIFRPKRAISDIKNKLDADFERYFHEGLMKKGMVLWLPENRVEQIKLKNGLKKSIIALIGIIESNSLSIIGCERELIAPQLLSSDTDIEAKLDMHLLAADNMHVILDLKWSSDATRHKKMLEEERAMQLDIYTNVLSSMPGGKSKIICGFFVMPLARLYTYHNEFKGTNVEIVNISHSYADAMLKIMNSYNYRILQMQGGFIEMNHDLAVRNLQYTTDAPNENLYKITDEDKKYFNYQSLLD